MVGIGEVIEDGEVDGENTHGGTGDGQGRQDPMLGGERSPAEPEEADGHEGALDAAEVQSTFGGGRHLAVVAGDFLLVDAQERGEGGADAHGGEDGAGLLQREGVVGAEDQRDGAEGQVQHRPAEGDPEGEEEDDGLGGEEVEGAEDGDCDHFGQAFALLVRFHFPADAFAVRFRRAAFDRHAESDVAGFFHGGVPFVQCLGSTA